MLKRIKQAASDQKGESYIYVCVLVLFISALVSTCPKESLLNLMEAMPGGL